MTAAAKGPDPPRHWLSAYGLSIECDWPLPGARPDPPPRDDPHPRVRISQRDADEFDAAWTRPAERVHEPEYPDGVTRFTIERSSHHYRLWFDGFGRYLLAVDGTVGWVQRGAVSRDRQERFLFAQVLPLAALLHGYDLIHAGAVNGPRGVAAFAGASGAGKSTMTSRLVLRGAGFVTDDVLVLERRSDALLVHPGPPFMALSDRDRSLVRDGDGRLGRELGRSDKLHASPPVPGHELPLRALYHLEPGPSFAISEAAAGNAQQLLGDAFAPYLMTRDRLLRHLELVHTISTSVRVYRLRVPRTGLPDVMLEQLEAELRNVVL